MLPLATLLTMFYYSSSHATANVASDASTTPNGSYQTSIPPQWIERWIKCYGIALPSMGGKEQVLDWAISRPGLAPTFMLKTKQFPSL